jgi:NADH dehydrogenase
MTDPISGVVAVDGATGYVGSHLVHKLCMQGKSVRAIVHPAAKEADCRFLESCGATIFKTDLDANSEVLLQALDGVACMIHLIGSIAPPKGQKLEDLHAGQTRQLVESCKKSSSRVIMVTALGSAADAESDYHRTKFQAEQLLRESGLPYIILRPSLILGRVVGHRDSKLMARYLNLIEERPRIPLVGGGINKLQPVFIDDLCLAILQCLSDESLWNKTMEIGGGEIISMKDLVTKLMDVRETAKPLLAIPPIFAKLAASLLQMVQTVPLLSCDQVKLSLKDNVCQDNALQSKMHVEPQPLQKALDTYKKSAAKA